MKLTLCLLLAVLVTGVLSSPVAKSNNKRFSEKGSTHLSTSSEEEEKSGKLIHVITQKLQTVGVWFQQEQEEVLAAMLTEEGNSNGRSKRAAESCLTKVTDLEEGFERDGLDAVKYVESVKARTDCPDVGKKRKKNKAGKRGTLTRVNLSFPSIVNHGNDFKIDITPNNKDQDGKFGMDEAVFDDGKEGFVMMKDDDSMKIIFTKTAYVRQLCSWSFVVKAFTVTYYNEKNKQVYFDTWCPSRTSQFFNFGCTQNDKKSGKFYQVKEIHFQLYHEPPHFTFRDMFAEICM